MQTRRDQVDAYRFSVARLSAALAEGDPGRGEAPFRRSGLGVTAGIVIGALITAGALVLGLIRPLPSAAAWRHQGAIVVAKETGTQFVYLGGSLHPTVNAASALLLSQGGASITYVPAKTLAGVAIGAELGIPGAPDLVPDQGSLLGGQWALCVSPDRPGGQSLRLGAAASRPGTGTVRPAALASSVVLVAGPRETGFVVWHGIRYAVPSHAVLIALGLGDTAPLQATAAWLAALPAGPALAPPTVPGAGRPGAVIGGHAAAVGQLYESETDGTSQFYVLLANGLAPVSRTEFALLGTAPKAHPAIQLAPSAVAAATGTENTALLNAVPDVLGAPVYQAEGQPLCVAASPGSGAQRLATAPAGDAAVVMPAGSGLLAAVAPGPGGRTPAYLITGGLKYPLGGGALAGLGYAKARRHILPAAVLDALPSGPLLSPAAAAQALP